MGIIEKITVDDATMARLAADAKRHGRTIEQEAEALRAGASVMSREDFIRRADAVAAMTPKGVRQTDSALLLREDRDR